MSDLNSLSATQSIQTLDTITGKYNLQDFVTAEKLVERCLICLCLKNHLSQSELLKGKSEAFHNVQVSFVLQPSQNGYINDNR